MPKFKVQITNVSIVLYKIDRFISLIQIIQNTVGKYTDPSRHYILFMSTTVKRSNNQRCLVGLLDWIHPSPFLTVFLVRFSLIQNKLQQLNLSLLRTSVLHSESLQFNFSFCLWCLVHQSYSMISRITNKKFTCMLKKN